ncbi:hypothetical protein [Ketobacter alkanivorans]|uniref:Uncharacterized protein n=1 Tax=Ketobacter alkanivorans TaxID=1917421 RepID=A0A2K9LJP5_9GAMM|nr:hypothetical protein [Ketobacter alkanivorans]AUM12470.1 hypothetical protein Kalk_08570 [Ketobacter alkanivorans]
MANVSDSSLELELSQNSYYLESASEKLSELMNKPFNVSRLFELAEHGEIAIAFSPEPSLAQRMYAQKEAKIKRFLYLNHSDILEFSPHNRNREIIRSVTAFEDANYARMYNAHASGNDTKKFPTDNPDSTDKLYCENLARTELVITKEELERFIKESKPTTSLEFCSYHDAGHILFNNDGITPRMRGHELEMWAYIDQDNLQPYLDKGLTRKTTTNECRKLGLNIESCYFSMTQVETFNPEAKENSGRWLTFQELIQRWSNQTPNYSLESLNNLITSVHKKAINTNHLELWPLSPDEYFYAVDPYSDVASCPQSGMFQLRQIEKFEEHHFKVSLSDLSNPESIGYEVAFQILNSKFECSAEEFTVWCNWDRWELKPYMDDQLKRQYSFFREEVSSLTDCLIGAFFNKTQVEQYEPNERYITHTELVHKIVEASGYDEARAVKLVMNKFHQDRGQLEKPDPVSNTNTLGMTWTTKFTSPTPSNAVFELEKVIKFIASSFACHTITSSNSASKIANTSAPATSCQPSVVTRTNQLHQLLMKIDEHLEKTLGKKPALKLIQKTLESHYAQFDDENIIQEIDEDTIYWRSKHGSEQKLSFGSLSATISKLRRR